MPSKIENTLDLPKVREMVLASGEKAVLGFIEFELIKLAERINVSGNLTDGQVEFIARQLLGMYPNETIADFKICFERGSSGAYGKIWKLDGVEIGNWMKLYLDEKYKVVEAEMMKEKDNQYQAFKRGPTDWLQLWKEAIAKTDAEGGVKTQSQNLTFLSHVRAMTEKQMVQEGGTKPKYQPYPFTPASIIEQRELHIQWIQENHDTHTGKPLPSWMPEEEWLKLKQALK